MKRIPHIAGVAAAALMVFACTAGANAAASKQRMITCPFLKEGRVSFDVPAKLGDLPKDIDFDHLKIE